MLAGGTWPWHVCSGGGRRSGGTGRGLLLHGGPSKVKKKEEERKEMSAPLPPDAATMKSRLHEYFLKVLGRDVDYDCK